MQLLNFNLKNMIPKIELPKVDLSQIPKPDLSEIQNKLPVSLPPIDLPEIKSTITSAASNAIGKIGDAEFDIGSITKYIPDTSSITEPINEKLRECGGLIGKLEIPDPKSVVGEKINSIQSLYKLITNPSSLLSDMSLSTFVPQTDINSISTDAFNDVNSMLAQSGLNMQDFGYSQQDIMKEIEGEMLKF